jgi:hypothetical protein
MINNVLEWVVMLRGRCSCALSLPPTSPSSPLSPYRFQYRFRPSLNCPVFLSFHVRTVSPTELSSIYPLSPLCVPRLYRKTGGGGRVRERGSFLATRHSPTTFSNSFPCHSCKHYPGVGDIKLANTLGASGSMPRITPPLFQRSRCSVNSMQITQVPGGEL